MYLAQRNGWLPESSSASSALAAWKSLAGGYDPESDREQLTQPLVVDWEHFEPQVQARKKVWDSLRAQKMARFPWEIARTHGIDWRILRQEDDDCAANATINAVQSLLLYYLDTGYPVKPFPWYNPYPTWLIGRRDAGYSGAGATLSMMLTAANKRGLFDSDVIGSYKETLNRRFQISDSCLEQAQKCQVGACYLGHLSGSELARAVFDCLAARYPVVMGTSRAIADEPVTVGNIKAARVSGSWMHATSRIAYRKEQDGSEWIAHQGSWGPWWPSGPEREPENVIWESWDCFKQQCCGRYTDAFVLTMVEIAAF